MSWLYTFIGIVIGVFLAAHSPESAEYIRTATSEVGSALLGIVNK